MLIGGKTGFGINICNRYNADCFSRSTGYNINNLDSRKEIASRSVEYNTVIVHAYSGNDSQLCVLQEIVKTWIENNHPGNIIVTGSIASYFASYKANPKAWEYVSHKAAIDAYCKYVSKKCIDGCYPFKITVIKPGMLDTEKSREKPHFIKGIDGEKYCDVIDFILTLPTDLIIPEIPIECIYD